MTGTAILLFGLPGAGKSSIGREIQARLTLPTVFVPLDVFDAPPDALCARILRERGVDETSFNGILLAAYFDCLRPWLLAGFNVIGEARPPTPEQYLVLRDKLDGLPFVTVHVIATPEVRLERSRRLIDRDDSWRAQEFPPHVTLVSDTQSAAQLAEELLARIHSERLVPLH